MATISQLPGDLDVQMTKDQAIAFSCVFTGDLTTSTWAATINNGSTTINLTTSASYLAPSTTVSVSLSQVQAQTLSLASYTWQLIQTTAGTARTILAGNWTVLNGY